MRIEARNFLLGLLLRSQDAGWEVGNGFIAEFEGKNGTYMCMAAFQIVQNFLVLLLVGLHTAAPYTKYVLLCTR